MKTRDEIDQVTTLPDMVALPKLVPKKTLDQKYPQVYIPVNIHIDKPSTLIAILSMIIIACTIIDVYMLFVHQIIIIR